MTRGLDGSMLIFAVLLTAVAGSCATPPAVPLDTLPLVPWPRSVEPGVGTLRLPPSFFSVIPPIGYSSEEDGVVWAFMSGLDSSAPAPGEFRESAPELQSGWPSTTPSFLFTPDLPLPEEGYRIEIDEDVRLIGHDAEALAHAAARVLAPDPGPSWATRPPTPTGPTATYRTASAPCRRASTPSPSSTPVNPRA